MGGSFGEEGELDSAAAGERLPDPGSVGARRIAFFAMLILFGLVVFLQQAGSSTSAPPNTGSPASASIEPPQAGPIGFMARLAIKLTHVPTGAPAGSPPPTVGMLEQLDQMARTPEDRLRVVMISAEIEGAEKAIERLDAEFPAADPSVSGAEPQTGLEQEQRSGASAEKAGERATADDAAASDGSIVPSPSVTSEAGGTSGESGESGAAPINAELRWDATALRAIYSAGNADGLDAGAREGLSKRHGYFGDLALTFGKDDADPARSPLIEGGGLLMAVLIVLGLGFVTIALAGLGLLIYFLVRLASGTLRSRLIPPAPGGSVYLETVAVFIGSFVMFKIVTGLLFAAAGGGPGPMRALALSAQWLLIVPVLWPLVRGVTFARFRRDVGLHSGEGVIREIGAGFVGYLAGIPLLIGGVILAFILLMIQQLIVTSMGGAPPAPPENPLLELFGSGDVWTIVAIGLLATLWAPLVEEAVFRGCLFRHARARVGVIAAAVGSALVFGGMHGYPGPLLIPVTVLGLVFALMRSWRGSLIAPMFAHFLHNATVTGILVVMIRVLGA
jgi:membrane protease YdiL (CAAX protease family)